MKTVLDFLLLKILKKVIKEYQEIDPFKYTDYL